MKRGVGATIEAWVYRKPVSKVVQVRLKDSWEARDDAGRLEPCCLLATSRGQGHAHAVETLVGVCICTGCSGVWDSGHTMSE